MIFSLIIDDAIVWTPFTNATALLTMHLSPTKISWKD